LVVVWDEGTSEGLVSYFRVDSGTFYGQQPGGEAFVTEPPLDGEARQAGAVLPTSYVHSEMFRRPGFLMA
jgi:hypothetical protein